MNAGVKSFCRICSGLCGTVVQLDPQGHIASIRGEKDHAMSRGYACFKALHSGAAHNAPERILRPQKRMADGSFSAFSLAQALDEIAAKLAQLRDSSGADALAVYRGTQNYLNVPAFIMLYSWMKALWFALAVLDHDDRPVGQVGRDGATRPIGRRRQALSQFGRLDVRRL